MGLHTGWLVLCVKGSELLSGYTTGTDLSMGKHGDSSLAWACCFAWSTAHWERHSYEDSGATSFASDAAHLGGFTVLTIRQKVSKLALLCPQAVLIQYRDETFSAFLHQV